MSMVKEEAEVVMRSPLPTEAPEVHFHFCCDIILLASGVTYWVHIYIDIRTPEKRNFGIWNLKLTPNFLHFLQFSLVVMMPFAAIGIGTNSFDAAPITVRI